MNFWQQTVSIGASFWLYYYENVNVKYVFFLGHTYKLLWACKGRSMWGSEGRPGAGQHHAPCWHHCTYIRLALCLKWGDLFRTDNSLCLKKPYQSTVARKNQAILIRVHCAWHLPSLPVLFITLWTWSIMWLWYRVEFK